MPDGSYSALSLSCSLYRFCLDFGSGLFYFYFAFRGYVWIKSSKLRAIRPGPFWYVNSSEQEKIILTPFI